MAAGKLHGEVLPDLLPKVGLCLSCNTMRLLTVLSPHLHLHLDLLFLDKGEICHEFGGEDHVRKLNALELGCLSLHEVQVYKLEVLATDLAGGDGPGGESSQGAELGEARVVVGVVVNVQFLETQVVLIVKRLLKMERYCLVSEDVDGSVGALIFATLSTDRPRII